MTDEKENLLDLRKTVDAQKNVIRKTEKNHYTVLYHQDIDGKKVALNSSEHFFTWILTLEKWKESPKGQKWFLSLTYQATFEQLFFLMDQNKCGIARFMSHMTKEWWEQRWKLEMKDFHNQGHWLVQAHITSISLSDSLENELKWMNAEANVQKHHPDVKRLALDRTWTRESSMNAENKGNFRESKGYRKTEVSVKDGHENNLSEAYHELEPRGHDLATSMGSNNDKQKTRAHALATSMDFEQKGSTRGYAFGSRWIRPAHASNIMLTGPSGVGKTTFIRNLMKSLKEKGEKKSPEKEPPELIIKEGKTTQVTEYRVKQRFETFDLYHRIIDTVGMGDTNDMSKTMEAPIQIIKDRILSHLYGKKYFIDEKDQLDPKVHMVLHFVNPNHSLRNCDRDFILEISKYTMVMVIVGKRDTMTDEECERHKRDIKQVFGDKIVSGSDIKNSDSNIIGPFCVTSEDRYYEKVNATWKREEVGDFACVRKILFGVGEGEGERECIRDKVGILASKNINSGRVDVPMLHKPVVAAVGLFLTVVFALFAYPWLFAFFRSIFHLTAAIFLAPMFSLVVYTICYYFFNLAMKIIEPIFCKSRTLIFCPWDTEHQYDDRRKFGNQEFDGRHVVPIEWKEQQFFGYLKVFPYFFTRLVAVVVCIGCVLWIYLKADGEVSSWLLVTDPSNGKY